MNNLIYAPVTPPSDMFNFALPVSSQAFVGDQMPCGSDNALWTDNEDLHIGSGEMFKGNPCLQGNVGNDLLFEQSLLRL